MTTCARGFSSVFVPYHCASKRNATYTAQHSIGRTRLVSLKVPYLLIALGPSTPVIQSRLFAHIHRKCNNCTVICEILDAGKHVDDEANLVSFSLRLLLRGSGLLHWWEQQKVVSGFGLFDKWQRSFQRRQ